MDFELALPPEVVSVAAGRRLVRAALSAWHLDELTETAALLTSEVLTNSVLHARTEIMLSVRRTGDDAVTISVRDGSTHLPQSRRHSLDASTGRGLELLNQLSSEWHVDREPDGKTVSFTVGAGADPWANMAATDWSEVEL